MRIAITTSGGDAPGLNAVIRGAASAALALGHEIFGSRNGFRGVIVDDTLIPLTRDRVEGIDRTGGTILGAASSGPPFGAPGAGPEALVEALQRHRIEALIMAGGDGTMLIAHQVSTAGIRVVGVPKTIDRDVVHTWTTFGFNTAVHIACEAIDRIHTTAASHERIMVVEVMGRDAGWVALHAGIGGGAHAILIPEIPYHLDAIVAHLLMREAAGHRYHIVVCSEGARPIGGSAVVSGRTGRYSGVAERLAAELAERTGKETRSLVLGHLLRGGAPTVFDRVLGLRFGTAAAQALHEGATDVMIAFQPPEFVHVPLSEVGGRMRLVPPDAPQIHTARLLGISFGD